MLVISDLRENPNYFDTVVDRIWRAFWKEKGYVVEQIAAPLRGHLSSDPIPFSLVAHADGLFLGTASVIVSDEETRPQYAPWVAAVWVEAEHRKRGVGAALVERATQAAFKLGVSRLYLGAARHRRPFYEKRGWTVLEEDVPRAGMAVLTRSSAVSDVEHS